MAQTLCRAASLAWVQQRKLKYTDRGDELQIGCLIKDCPNFQQPQMYINIWTEVWYCHRCHSKGRNLKELEFRAGFVTFDKPVASSHIYISEPELNAMHKKLFQNASALTYLIDRRGFTKSTLLQFKLGYKDFADSPAIVIPYFDKTQTCVGLKYNLFLPTNETVPKYRFEPKSKMMLYNVNCINLAEKLFVTEGEYDAMSLWQSGHDNVVSIPTGAGGAGEWLEDIKPAPCFILSYDNDTAGEEGAKTMSALLGRTKCFRAYPRLKDWNEYLQRNIPKALMDNALAQTTPMFDAPVLSISQYKEEVLNLIQNPELFKGITTGWKTIDAVLGGIREKEVTVASGITGHGKTTFALALAINLLIRKHRVLILSPEMPEPLIYIELASGHYRKRITTEAEVNEYDALMKDRLFIANVSNDWTEKHQSSLINQVFDVIDYAAKQNNVKLVILDHLRFFLDADQEKERSEIDRFMQRCVRTAINNNIHIWLIVQPRKNQGQERKITLHHLKGSSNIEQDAHNVLIIHRDFDVKKSNLVEVEIAKNRRCGLTGTTVLNFDLKSKANYYETLQK